MQRLTVQDATDVANARRRVAIMAGSLGYDETALGRASIVVTELAQNLLRHAGGGEMLAGPDDQAPGGMQILALDRGPGMRDVVACLRDGFSTAGTAGNGLGAIHRLSAQMLIHSRPGGGTAVLVRLASQADIRRTNALLRVPKPGETECGDDGAVVALPDGRVAILLCDGLGHGPLAAAASAEAVRLFRVRADQQPNEILAALHAGLRATRGAALAVAVIDHEAGQVAYGGIGNITAFITDSSGTRRMVSQNGTAGHTAGRLQTFHYPIHAQPALVMFSDGLSSSWGPANHSGLFGQDPMLVAGVLYRDHARGRDDASVVVWKG